MGKKRKKAYPLAKVNFAIDQLTLTVVVNRFLELENVSGGFLSALGYQRKELLGHRFRKIFDDLDAKMISDAFVLSGKTGRMAIVGISLKSKEGKRYIFEAEFKRVKNDRAVLSFSDISGRVEGIGGVLNRQGFFLLGEAEFNVAQKLKKKAYVFIVDIDNLKQINDNFGHLEGDDVILKVAESLRSVFNRKSDVVARIGGDEFAVVVVGNDEFNPEVAEEKFRKKLRDIYAPILDVKRYCGEASIGYSVVDFSLEPENTDSTAEFYKIVDAADREMYAYKKSQRKQTAGMDIVTTCRFIFEKSKEVIMKALGSAEEEEEK